jgi:hypothetical protein
MDLIDRYLDAIAGHLPADKAQDIVAELRDLLLSRQEEQEAAAGRPLGAREVEAMLKEFGPPLAVAARYWPTRYLIGPEVFPYWWACLKMVLLIVTAVFVSLCFAELLFAAGPSGRIVGRAISAVWTSAWATTCGVTAVFAVIERFAPRGRFRFDWTPAALPRLRESEQSRWNRVSQLTGEVILLLWCVGVLKVGLPHGWSFSLSPASLWPDMYWPVIGLLCAAIVIDLVALGRPDLYTPRAVAYIATRFGWLGLAAFVWAAKPQLMLAAPHLTLKQAAGVELGIAWAIRVTLLSVFLTMLFQGALETFRLVRRLGGRNGDARLSTSA